MVSMAQGVEICAVSWHIIPKMKIKNQKYIGVYAHVGVYGSTGTLIERRSRLLHGRECDEFSTPREPSASSIRRRRL